MRTDHAGLEKLLKQYRGNLQLLEEQAALYGGEAYAPIVVQNQLRDTRDKIAEFEAQLQPADEVVFAKPAEHTAPRQRAGAHDEPPRPLRPTQQIMLDILVQPAGVQIAWSTPVSGHETTVFKPPYAPTELPVIIRALDVVQYPNYPKPATPPEQRYFTFDERERSVLVAFGLWKNNRVPADAHQKVGAQIYQAVGSDGQRVLAQLRNAAIDQRLANSYALRFAPESIALAALPWELLWDDQTNQPILIHGSVVDSCDRYVSADGALAPPLAAGERLHMLALAPNYGIAPDVRAAERTARQASWEQLAQERDIVTHEISPLTIQALNDYLDQAAVPPDIIHYYGHGISRDGKSYLVFDHPRGGQDLVSTERLAGVLGDARLMVIQLCQSAAVTAEGGLLTGLAPAISLLSSAVVAMQLTCSVGAAARFTEVFYEQLLSKRRSVQDAVAHARQVLFTEDQGWYVPTLYIRGQDPRPLFILEEGIEIA
jgi:hypothetical protein